MEDASTEREPPMTETESLKDALGIFSFPSDSVLPSSPSNPSSSPNLGDTFAAAQIRARRAKRAALRGQGCRSAKRGKLKRKFQKDVRYVGTVGGSEGKTITLGGRTRREAERRLRKAFREAGISSQP